MKRLVSSLMALGVVALFLSPVGLSGDTRTYPSDISVASAASPTPSTDSLDFPDPVDTSGPVPEYTMVSRALMLSGGSTDVVLDDLNNDGLADLVVAVYEAMTISVFYRQVDGTFKTYPSLNITTLYYPLSVRTADIYASGHRQIIALESNPTFSDTRLAVYNLTSPTSYERWPDRSTYSNGIALVVGYFSPDVYVDVAVACEGPTPQSTAGKLEVFFGPNFSTFELLTAGRGARTIVAADFDDDAELEVAVGNFYQNSVMIFERPFSSGDPPSSTLTVEGNPAALLAGQFNDDSLTDLVVGTESSSALRFYYQSTTGLPISEDLNMSLAASPSCLVGGDLNADSLEDILVLSREGNVSAGYYQRIAAPFWGNAPDFVMPCGGMPRAAVIGDMDGDLASDIAVASARSDWSGSSIALYPFRYPAHSNSNATVWTSPMVETTCIASGDVNGDDVIDLILVNPSDMSLGYVLSFDQPVGTLSLGHSPERALVSDFNGDSSADVLISASDSPLLVIAYGGSSFPSQVVELPVGGAITDFGIGDFNHDSLIDFVVATENGALDFYFNDGSDDPFSSPPYEMFPSAGAGIWSIAVGDFNSDGLDDIAFPRPIRKISILLQDVTIPFGPSSPTLTLTHPTGGDFTSVWSGDLTGDGKTDIAAMRLLDNSMYLFDQNDFSGSQSSYGTIDFPERPAFVSVTDATDDGPADILALFDSADLLFLYRQSGGALPSSPSMVFVTGANPTCAVIGDGTRDHRGDLLVFSSGSSCVSIWQQINFPPIAHSGGPYFAREGDPLQLNGTATTGTSEIPYLEYLWDFGDGNNTGWVRQPRPVHTYFVLGNYTITVAVRDPAGLVSLDSTYVIVEDSYPHVSFSWTPPDVREGQLVTFTDETTSFDPVVNRSWTVNGIPFGDEPIISSEFQNGTHEVVLTVTDSDGTTISLAKYVEVDSVPPTLRIVGPSEAEEGVPVEFLVLVDEWHLGPVDPIVSYEWDFGYVEDNFVPDPMAPNNYSVNHTFSASAYWKLFRVAVRVVDSDGMENTTTWDIRIFDSAPVAGLTMNTTDPREGIPFVFISTSTSYDGVVNWTWRLEHPDSSEEVFWLDDRAMALHEFDYLDDGDYVMRLTVREADGNTSTSTLMFHVRELPPIVNLTAEEMPGAEGYYLEFTQVNFSCPVEGVDQGVLWEWDFDSPGAAFEVDMQTYEGYAAHVYGQVGNHTAKVRVFDSDGSFSTASMTIDVRQKPLTCEIYRDIRVIRVAPNTEDVTFDASNLLTKHPDIISLTFEFGDGASGELLGPPFSVLHHSYAIGRDYLLNVTIEDDDGYTLVSRGTIFVVPPKIELLEPFDGAVLRSGATLLFLVTPGSTPLNTVVYDVNDVGFRPFSTQYIINTTGWPDADYRIAVIAWDHGGNIAILRYVHISIDDIPPVVVLYSERTKVYAGSKFTITVWVADRNVEVSGVTLHVMFPGDRAFLAYPVLEGDDGNFFREFDAPTTEGKIEFFVRVTDLAGNSAVSESYSLDVRIPFLTIAWPYLLASSALGALGLGGYLVRESKIAVDEAFVIHNDGRMISHSTRRLKPGMDDQVLSGMFTAIQDFVRESFKDITSFTLRKIEFGEKSVLIEKGRNVYLAVILHGHASKKVAAKMQRVVDEIESKFGKHLEDWDGDLEKLRGVNDITKRIYSKAPLLPKFLRSG